MLVFLNLDVDYHLNPQMSQGRVFSVRSPFKVRILDSYQILGVYSATSDDELLTNIPIPLGFKDYLERHSIPFPRIRLMPESPSSPECLEVFLKQVRSHPPIRTSNQLQAREYKKYRFAAKSIFEQRLWNELYYGDPKIADSEVSTFQKLNDKRKLLTFARALNFNFPKSKPIYLSDLSNALEEKGLKFPILAKENYSSGGAGIINLENRESPLIRFLEKKASSWDSDSEWIFQECKQRKKDFSTFCDVLGGNVTLGSTFELKYNQKNSSWLHASTVDPGVQKIQEVVVKLGGLLHELGYEGSFGVDSFLTTDGELFPAIDLNARVDKSRLIFEAACAFGIEKNQIFTQRLNFLSIGHERFDEWWDQCCHCLSLDELGYNEKGNYFFPFVVGSLFPRSSDTKRPVEISYFFGNKRRSTLEELEPWRALIEVEIPKI